MKPSNAIIHWDLGLQKWSYNRITQLLTIQQEFQLGRGTDDYALTEVKEGCSKIVTFGIPRRTIENFVIQEDKDWEDLKSSKLENKKVLGTKLDLLALSHHQFWFPHIKETKIAEIFLTIFAEYR